jgi:hypothetical protein
MVEEHHLDGIPLIVAPAAESAWRVHTTPYTVAVDEQGIVRAKGIANELSHLESLVNAVELGHPSIESFVAAHDRANTKELRPV